MTKLYQKEYDYGKSPKTREMSPSQKKDFAYLKVGLPEHLNNEEFRTLTNKIKESADAWTHYTFALTQVEKFKSAKKQKQWERSAEQSLEAYQELNPEFKMEAQE